MTVADIEYDEPYSQLISANLRTIKFTPLNIIIKILIKFDVYVIIRLDKITLLSQLRNYNVVCDEQLHNID